MATTRTRWTNPSRLPASSDALANVLSESRRLGLLGPGDIASHIEHALGFADALALGEVEEDPIVADLGAGGGIPSLPIACAYERIHLVLIDAAAKRTSFLVWAIVELDLADRVEVVRGRAEVLGHEPEHRFRYDAVVARSFGPPSTTLECAAALLRPSARCAISEPPLPRSWSAPALRELGLCLRPCPSGYAVFERTGSVPDDIPRSARAQRARPFAVVDEHVDLGDP